MAKADNGGKITALYERLSKDDLMRDESLSIANQRTILEEFAIKNGLRKFEHFSDDGFSGTTMERPEFQRMISEIESGKIGSVIVKDMSRFGREHIYVGLYIEHIFPTAGVRFMTADGTVDTANKSIDNSFLPIVNIFNEFHARDTSKKVKAVKASMARQGISLCGIAPYGYKIDENDRTKWLIDEPTAEVVRDIFQMYVSGVGTKTICNTLMKRGILPPFDYHYYQKNTNIPAVPMHRWNSRTISFFLTSEAYIGTYSALKATTVSFKNHTPVLIPREDWVTIKNHHEPIIDEITFETAKKFWGERTRPQRIATPSPLHNLVFCADCSHKLYSTNRIKTRKGVFSCSNYKLKNDCTIHSIDKEIIEQLVLTEIQAVVNYARENETQFVEQIRKNSAGASVKASKSKVNELGRAEKRIVELDKIIQRIYEDNINGKLSDERFGAMLQNYETEQNELKVKAEQLRTEISALQKEELNVDNFLKLVKKCGEITELTLEIARLFIEKIVVHESVRTDENNMRSRKISQRVDIYFSYIGCLNVDAKK
ncbi:MAG: recombinase family protein [Prevotellaceae bacterium]|nr:recombinase family protein [Prevotellaceae bacterium]